MKIIPFKPQAPPAAASRPEKPSRDAGQVSAFEAELRAAGRMTAPNVVDKISLENRLASQGAAPDDVDAAGSLLSALLSSVKAASPETLQKVHDIDGILYYFQI
jgi:hypothetical protein